MSSAAMFVWRLKAEQKYIVTNLIIKPFEIEPFAVTMKSTNTNDLETRIYKKNIGTPLHHPACDFPAVSSSLNVAKLACLPKELSH